MIQNVELNLIQPVGLRVVRPKGPLIIRRALHLTIRGQLGHILVNLVGDQVGTGRATVLGPLGAAALSVSIVRLLLNRLRLAFDVRHIY